MLDPTCEEMQQYMLEHFPKLMTPDGPVTDVSYDLLTNYYGATIGWNTYAIDALVFNRWYRLRHQGNTLQIGQI